MTRSQLASQVEPEPKPVYLLAWRPITSPTHAKVFPSRPSTLAEGMALNRFSALTPPLRPLTQHSPQFGTIRWVICGNGSSLLKLGHNHMKLTSLIWLALLLSSGALFGANVPYTAFRGVGGITVSSNVSLGTVTIDGSGIAAGALPTFALTNNQTTAVRLASHLKVDGILTNATGIKADGYLQVLGAQTNKNDLFIEDPGSPGIPQLWLENSSGNPGIFTLNDFLFMGFPNRTILIESNLNQMGWVNAPYGSIVNQNVVNASNFVAVRSITLNGLTAGRLLMLNSSKNATNSGAEIATIDALTDPGADRILFWDDSDGAYKFLTVGSGLDITATTLTATGGAGTPAGSSGAIEFVEGAAFAGTNKLVFNRTNHQVNLFDTDDTTPTNGFRSLTAAGNAYASYGAFGIFSTASEIAFGVGDGTYASRDWSVVNTGNFVPATTDSKWFGISTLKPNVYANDVIAVANLHIGAITNRTQTVGDNLHVNGTNRTHRYDWPVTNASVVLTNFQLNTPIYLVVMPTAFNLGGGEITFNVPAAAWVSGAAPVVSTNAGPTIYEFTKVSTTRTNAVIVQEPFLTVAFGRRTAAITNYVDRIVTFIETNKVTALASNATEGFIDGSLTGTDTTELNNHNTAVTLYLTNGVHRVDHWTYITTDGTSRAVTVATNLMAGGWTIRKSQGSVTNGGANLVFTVTNGVPARLNTTFDTVNKVAWVAIQHMIP